MLYSTLACASIFFILTNYTRQSWRPRNHSHHQHQSDLRCGRPSLETRADVVEPRLSKQEPQVSLRFAVAPALGGQYKNDDAMRPNSPATTRRPPAHSLRPSYPSVSTSVDCPIPLRPYHEVRCCRRHRLRHGRLCHPGQHAPRRVHSPERDRRQEPQVRLPITSSGSRVTEKLLTDLAIDSPL